MIDPGLDLTTLRALTRPAHDEQQILSRIRTHLDTHDGYIAFSGGKDSLAVLHLALQAEPNVPVVFFDSGLEFPDTHDYLHQVTDHLNIPGGIQTYRAQPGLLELLMDNGSWDHTRSTSRALPDLRRPLIDQPAARAHTDHGAGLLWGIRSAESAGRAHLHRTALRDQLHRACHGCCTSQVDQRRRHGGVVDRADGTTSYSPVWDWTTQQVWQYLARQQLPLNPLYAHLTRLGAPPAAHRVTSIIDAHQLQSGRVVWLRRGWPAIYTALQQALPRISEAI